MTRTHETWTVAADGAALAAEIHTHLQVSHRQAKGLIDAGCVKLEGQEARTYGVRLKEGTQLEVHFDPAQTYNALPHPSRSRDVNFEILWEDKHLIFVNKAAGLLTVPTEKQPDACLAEALTDHYRRRGFKRFQLYIAHRLDRFTSGVLVFAKTPEALNGLKNIFEEHNLNRVYKAILVGELPENAGTLTDKLVERKSLRMDVVPTGATGKHDLKGAKLAVTHYRVIERLPGHTVVEVRLETGRRNQIRVQFSDRGFPLLGDMVYGDPSPLIDRQALHAELLGFRHPVTGEGITITAPAPGDFERALKALRTTRRVIRAEAGLQGEEGIYKPRITKERKQARMDRAERFAPGAPRESPSARTDRAPSRMETRPAALRGKSHPGGRSEGPSAASRTKTRPDAGPDARPEAPRGKARAEGRPFPSRTAARGEGRAPAPRSRPSRPAGPETSGESSGSEHPYVFPAGSRHGRKK